MNPTQVTGNIEVDQLYINREQAMALLGVSRTTLATLVKRHRIQKCTLTRRPLYRRSDLIDLVESNMSAKTTKAAS